MTPIRIVRLSWAILALPLAAMSLLVTASMLPLVLQNNGARLGLIAYVIVCPLLPLFWRGTRVALILWAACLSLILQIVAIGIINFWFR